MATFGERLRFLRTSLGVSQAQVADLLGVTNVTISDYERGRRRPAGEHSLEVYETLADFFHVDLPYLLGRSDRVLRLSGRDDLDDAAGVSLEVTPDELALLRAYREAPDNLQAAVRAILCLERRP